MSRCGKTHLLESVVQGEIPGDELRAHAQRCSRCRHELNWLEVERGLFRQRAARDAVNVLWQGVDARTGAERRRRRVNRPLLGLAASLLVILGVGRALIAGSSEGRSASTATSTDVLMTENAISQERAELCSRSERGIGFYCGYLPGLIASR
jgi:hypothetical protein